MDVPKAMSKRAADRQERILDSALAVILRHGFDRCAMQDIASESGITRAALYRYFGNKDEVLHALVTSINAKANQAALLESQSDRPFAERLFRVLDARLGRIQKVLRKGSHGIEISDATHRVTGELTTDADREYVQILKDMFVGAARRGEIDSSRTGISPERYAEIAIFSAKGLMKEEGDITYREDYSEILHELCDVICSSLIGTESAS